MSPGTTSPEGIVRRLPPRNTCASGAASLRKAARACSARRSWMMPKPALRITMARMAPASSHSFRKPEIAAAATSSQMTKLLNCCHNICRKEVGGASSSWLGP